MAMSKREKHKVIRQLIQKYGHHGGGVENKRRITAAFKELYPTERISWQMVAGIMHQVTPVEWRHWKEKASIEASDAEEDVIKVPVGTGTGVKGKYTDKDYRRDSVRQMLDPAEDKVVAVMDVYQLLKLARSEMSLNAQIDLYADEDNKVHTAEIREQFGKVGRLRSIDLS